MYIESHMRAQIKKSDTAKLSHSGKVGKPAAGKASKNTTSGVRTFLRRAFWLLLVLAILASIALTLIWYNRTSLLESQIRKLLAKQGYEVTLDISKLTKTQAIASDIEMRKNGVVFFKTKRAIIDYNFGKRMAQRIALEQPYLKIELAKNGKITSSWMPPKSDNPRKLLLPPQGLSIEGGVIDWQVTLGETNEAGIGQTHMDANIASATHWSANISGTKAVFNAEMLKGDITHDIFIETKNGQSFDVFGAVSGQGLRTELLPQNPLQAKTLKSQFKLSITRAKTDAKPEISGWYMTKITGLSLPDYTVANADIHIRNFKKTADNQINGHWQMNAQGGQISNLHMRANLADKLTSHSALEDTPIAKYFTNNLRNKAAQLLGGFDVSGQGTFRASPAGYVIALEQTLRLQAADQVSGQQTIIFTPQKADFIDYNKARQTMTMQADIHWSGKQALAVKNFTMQARSANGAKLDSIQNMSARIRSQKQWRPHNGAQNIRLAPFDIDFAYADQGDNIRNVTIKGGIDYDGPVPGGDVIGLVADGVMNVRLRGNTFTLGYTPTKPLSIANFTNPSGWTSKALQFTMEPQTDLLRKTSRTNVMGAKLRNVRTQIIGPEDKRHLNAQFETMNIRADFAKSPIHWQIGVQNTDIKSEDFPAPGTHIISPNADLNVYQAQSGLMTFDLLSPDTFVSTDNAKIKNLNIGLQGSPDNMAFTYNAGSVTMVGGTVPVLPMHGTAQLKSGVLIGRAITNLPKTKDTPIDIQFRSKDGQGRAKIIIPKIIFDPRGLQPQQLVPVLRGKLAEVSGEASAEFDFVFGGGQPVQSSGWADLKGLDVGTLVGPLSGVNAKLVFTSIFPLKTEGVQTATLSGFDPGFPLKNGTIKFAIVPGGIKIIEAVWPIENISGTAGKIYLSPTDWRFADVENRVEVNVENVGLGTMLANIGKDKFSATGQVFGTLPARINGVDVLIENGVLAVEDGGVIRYKSATTDATAARNKNAEYAFKALENFHYKQLEARIDGPIDGDMALKIVFDGQNQDVLGGQTFQFNTLVLGELANIARNLTSSFSNEENLSRIMEIQKSKTTE